MNLEKKVMLVILDGIGLNKNTQGNAFYLAKKPNIDFLLKNYPHSVLEASGPCVGLPTGQMGNSEVGHLNIGAGRIIYTGLSLINKEIEDNKFFDNEAFLKAVEHVKKNNSKLHILGLCSKGGVHSSFEHISALIKFAKIANVPTIIDCISDGRDVDPHSFINDLESILKLIKNSNIKLGLISGRYYAMDRDTRWERVDLAYQALVNTDNDIYYTDPIDFVKKQYDSNITDEFIKPAANGNYDIKQTILSNNDAIIFANFRPDRAREISHMIYGSDYYDYEPKIKLKNICLVTMMNYEGIVPTYIAYPPLKIKNVLGETLSNSGLSQLRIAETEKYAHVTFFFDGGIEIDYKNEEKILVNSPKVATYDLQPEMSAKEVTNKILDNMDKFDVIIANFANGDMVGHTGNLSKTIEAVEFLDKCLKRIYDKSKETNTTLFITSDHGNCDDMLDENNNPITKHSLAPVFFISTDKSLNLHNGKLSNIAPTILKYVNIKIPKDMNEEPLF